MLVLTRKIGETIDIADGKIKITIIDIDGSRISIGIDADRDIKVLRGEILERIKSQDR